MPHSSIPELQSFGVSPTKGFLSPQAPLTAFKGSYFEPWDTLVGQLPELLSKGQLRDTIHALPILDATKLSSEMEHRRAYVVLGYSVHAYVWSNMDDGKPAELVPPQLAEPFLVVCEYLGMQPVLSYAGLCLWNWVAQDGATCAEGDFFALEQLHCIGSFTGRRGEDCFNLVSVLIEAEGGTAVQLLLDALRAAERGDAAFVIQSLNNSAERLVTMGRHLFKLFGTLDADEFFHKIRPWLSGGKGMEDKGLPDGMIFQKDDGTLQAVKCVGGNAGQSSLFPLLDCILGVKHETPIDGAPSIFQEMRAYMPGQHRKLLAEMARVAPLRAFVEANPTNEGLLGAYNNCLDKLRSWRGKHIAVVSKYIIRPAIAAQKHQNNTVNGIELEQTLGDDADGFEATAGKSLKGTGGTEIIPFLIQARDETVGVWRN